MHIAIHGLFYLNPSNKKHHSSVFVCDMGKGLNLTELGRPDNHYYFDMCNVVIH